MNWTASDIAVYYLDEFEILGLHVDPEDKKFIEIDIAINDIHVQSVNLQYNTLVCWDDGTNDSWTKCLVFQVLFLSHKILQNSLKKPFQSFSLFSIELQK